MNNKSFLEHFVTPMGSKYIENVSFITNFDVYPDGSVTIRESNGNIRKNIINHMPNNIPNVYGLSYHNAQTTYPKFTRSPQINNRQYTPKKSSNSGSLRNYPVDEKKKNKTIANNAIQTFFAQRGIGVN